MRFNVSIFGVSFLEVETSLVFSEAQIFFAVLKLKRTKVLHFCQIRFYFMFFCIVQER